MSYYITAHRYGNRFNVPIEEKHKYITDSVIALNSVNQLVGYSTITGGSSSVTNGLTIAKNTYSDIITAVGRSKTQNVQQVSLNCVPNYVRLFYRPQNLTIIQGTGPQERIGDKVYLKNVKIYINISLLPGALEGLNGNDEVQNTLTTSYPVSYASISQATSIGLINSATDTNIVQTYNNKRLNTKQFYKFRIMIVRFNDFDFKSANIESRMVTYVANWFNTIFLPQIIIPKQVESNYVDIPVVSVMSKTLRESTEYNGKYSIIYDQVIELNEKDSSKHITINLDPKINLTFGSDNKPTSEDFKNVIGFILPPLYYKTDMDLISMNELNDVVSGAASIGEFTTNIKFTYYDI